MAVDYRELVAAFLEAQRAGAGLYKGQAVRVFNNQIVASGGVYLADIVVDMRGYNAASIAVLPTGTSPSATIKIKGSDSPFGVYETLPDANATQTGVTAADLFDVSVGTAFLRVELSAGSGTYGAGLGWTIIVTPYVAGGISSVSIAPTASQNLAQLAGSNLAVPVDTDSGAGTEYRIPVAIVAPASGGSVTMPGDVANGLDVDVTRLPALVAGSAIVGKVGIDQTTPGTTDSVSVATGQGAGATIGTAADAAVSTDTTGTLSGKLRGIVKILADIWSDAANAIRTEVIDNASRLLGIVTFGSSEKTNNTLRVRFGASSGNRYGYAAEQTTTAANQRPFAFRNPSGSGVTIDVKRLIFRASVATQIIIQRCTISSTGTAAAMSETDLLGAAANPNGEGFNGTDMTFAGEATFLVDRIPADGLLELKFDELLITAANAINVYASANGVRVDLYIETEER